MDHPLERTPDSKNRKISEISLKGAVCNQIRKEYMDAVYDNVPHVSTPKRKRAANVIASDTESDVDDNVPISKLKRLHLQESIPHVVSMDSVPPKSDDVKGPVTRSRRRLATLRNEEGKVKASFSPSNTSKTNYRGIPTTDDVEDSESDDAGSDSEGGSLDGFIVSDDTYASDADDTSSESEEKPNDVNDAFGLSDDGSDDDTDFGMILSRFQRSKDHKFKWEFEGDMLSDFGKDPELCMKAVCALYRQQSDEEKLNKETLHGNGRGFSKFDAPRYKFRFFNLFFILANSSLKNSLRKVFPLDLYISPCTYQVIASSSIFHEFCDFCLFIDYLKNFPFALSFTLRSQ
jgi:hypothetical protein